MNTLLFIGGLGDGLLTVHYPSRLARSSALPPSWRIVEVLTSSSYKGWGTGSLARDARELGCAVAYFRALGRPGHDRGGGEEEEEGKVVLLGHSTGCQDVLAYLTGAGAEARPRVDGIVLQGGVSDREAWDSMTPAPEDAELAAIKAAAAALVADGKGAELLQANLVSRGLGNAPMSAYRTHSLLAEGGDDDFFSSDLGDEVLARSFGAVPRGLHVLFLLGGEDPYVPASVDKEALVGRWAAVLRGAGARVWGEGGGVLVEGGHHNFNDDAEGVLEEVCRRVGRFLGDVEGGGQEKGAERL